MCTSSYISLLFCCLVAKLCPTLYDSMDCKPTRFLCLWDFPGKNTGVGCCFFLQGIFLIQGSNPHLLHLQADSFFFPIYLYQFEANYFTVLQGFLPYTDMNQPWIYMYSPSRSPLPPSCPPNPSGSSQCTSPEHQSHASNLGW